MHTVVRRLTSDDTELSQWYEYAKVVRQLYDRYGKTIKTPVFIAQIERTDATVGQLLDLLAHYQLVNAKDLDVLVHHLRSTWKEYENMTHIYIPESAHARELKSKLEKRFDNSKTKTLTQDDIGIHVQSNDKAYKRLLTNDIKQLLY
jgi:hypothetical protein